MRIAFQDHEVAALIPPSGTSRPSRRSSGLTASGTQRGPVGRRSDPATSRAPWRIYNIGNCTPVELMEVVRLLERALGKTALKELMPMQPGDVHANVDALQMAV